MRKKRGSCRSFFFLFFFSFLSVSPSSSYSSYPLYFFFSLFRCQLSCCGSWCAAVFDVFETLFNKCHIFLYFQDIWALLFHTWLLLRCTWRIHKWWHVKNYKYKVSEWVETSEEGGCCVRDRNNVSTAYTNILLWVSLGGCRDSFRRLRCGRCRILCANRLPTTTHSRKSGWREHIRPNLLHRIAPWYRSNFQCIHLSESAVNCIYVSHIISETMNWIQHRWSAKKGGNT